LKGNEMKQVMSDFEINVLEDIRAWASDKIFANDEAMIKEYWQKKLQ